MVRTVGRGDLVVEDAGQDKADGRTASAADICKNLFERRDSHGRNIAEHDDNSGDDGEAELAHWLGLRLKGRNGSTIRFGGTKKRSTVLARGRRLSGTRTRRFRRALGPPADYSVDGSSARVYLQRVREHDENDDGQATNSGGG